MSSSDLPEADSTNVHLAVATPEELRVQWTHNVSEWRGPFSEDDYYRREEHLLEQALTRNGGLTPWVLVHQRESTGTRQVLCGCETLKKRALLSNHGRAEEATCHGVASVFCPVDNRGRGYAGRMMKELALKLGTWQNTQEHKVLFSILFSDIGKDYYAKQGWKVFPSAHISLNPSPRTPSGLPEAQALMESELPALCAKDEALLRDRIAKAKPARQKRVAVIPDASTIAWHQARAAFFAKVLFTKDLDNKGAMVDRGDGRRAWCYWQHRWSSLDEQDKENKLYVLRVVLEDDQAADFAPASEQEVGRAKDSESVLAVAALLAAAQAEASRWGFGHVECWNPSTIVLAAARHLSPDITVQHRESSSITSLLWYGEGSGQDVEWVCNERYGWC